MKIEVDDGGEFPVGTHDHVVLGRVLSRFLRSPGEYASLGRYRVDGPAYLTLDGMIEVSDDEVAALVRLGDWGVEDEDSE